MPRDNFSAKVINTVAKRAALHCSNPTCRRLTAGPHTDQGKSSSIGVAAHIVGAAPAGPRSDSTLSPAARRDAENCIWLCKTCSRVIDVDPDKYPPELLHGWKSAHEQWVAERLASGDIDEYGVTRLQKLDRILESLRATRDAIRAVVTDAEDAIERGVALSWTAERNRKLEAVRILCYELRAFIVFPMTLRDALRYYVESVSDGAFAGRPDLGPSDALWSEVQSCAAVAAHQVDLVLRALAQPQFTSVQSDSILRLAEVLSEKRAALHLLANIPEPRAKLHCNKLRTLAGDIHAHNEFLRAELRVLDKFFRENADYHVEVVGQREADHRDFERRYKESQDRDA